MQPFKKPIYVTRPLLPSIDNYIDRIEDIWESKWITNNGQQHQKLEEELKGYLKADNLSLINNGTIALQIALKALNLTGEVITTPFTFAATPHAISWNSLKPVFCDIVPETLNIDTDKIEGLVTEETSAILAVHVFGTPCNVEKIDEIARKYDLKIIYDGAHAFGTEINGTAIGNYGDITMYSFHATKLFNTIEGGALACSNENLKEKINLLRNFGIKNEEEVVSIGTNGKMNEFQAAMGLEVLKKVEEERRRRKEIKGVYHQELEDIDGISFIPESKDVKSSQQYLVIRINEEVFGLSRDEVYEKLKEYNVFSRKYFYPLCSNYEMYNDLSSSQKEKLPVANKIVKEVLALPFHGDLNKNDVIKICNIIKEL
ncbi:dTDP-4-amino-4,6-dideoxygalactose transaminase [Halanaerobium saccharolyticum]|jgi:dTDP-4-amino-4,6-dideoxygalactose transaminase|uniref:dTDP-4-amino-4,6-dideoxygalactose transaminase n=1 Tax=Halanaerobium saccharolyticum TaxID=43595 RepID=A0A2T5RHU6_9FIRM|nr:DegT/DnrJ/EryC1/StrS family aminotransferase [Halanaerobium saccharolyticum]PTV96832.1 dTDP-4-amino-4,6-dideoxygalactose transaminase [Halanaerobium saccharolyticum]